MRILLDECITKDLLKHLIEFDVQTTRRMGWGGLNNGALLAQAARAGFDLLLTIDKNILYQQSITAFDLSLVVFDTPSSKIEHLVRFLPEFKRRVHEFEKRRMYLISLP